MSNGWWVTWSVCIGMLACSLRDEVYWSASSSTLAIQGLALLAVGLAGAILVRRRRSRSGGVTHTAAAMVVAAGWAFAAVLIGGRVSCMEWSLAGWSLCTGVPLQACMDVGYRGDGALLLNPGGGLLVWRGTLEKFAFMPVAGALGALLGLRWSGATGTLTWLRGIGGTVLAAVGHASVATLLFCAYDEPHAALADERTLMFLSGWGGTVTALVALTFWLPNREGDA